MSSGRSPVSRGKLLVISAPSGSGKTTIAKEIISRNPSLEFSVSATTRKQRHEEVEGRDYYFLTKHRFMEKVRAREFAEWEELYGNYYGTLKSEIDRALLNTKNLLFDVDVKGGLSIKRLYPKACLIFIRPPSVSALRERLVGRHTEDEVTLAERLKRVPMELERGNTFDFQVVNDDLTKAIDEVQTIVDRFLHS